MKTNNNALDSTPSNNHFTGYKNCQPMWHLYLCQLIMESQVSNLYYRNLYQIVNKTNSAKFKDRFAPKFVFISLSNC